jgi:hypothetical protein
MKPIRSFIRAAAAVLALPLLAAVAQPARAQSIWLSPMDPVTQHGVDYELMFSEPQTWQSAAKAISTFAVNANYLLRSDPTLVKNHLAWLQANNIKLAVGVGILPANKNVCGNGVEGMIWPNEANLIASQLYQLGAQVDYFILDEPLTHGTISNVPNACHYTVQQNAQQLAYSIKQVRKYYPTAKFVDAEIPTGIPLSTWLATLADWVPAYQQATGEPMYEMALDVWWKFPWHDAVANTQQQLSTQGIRTAIYIDASEGNNVAAGKWVLDARASAVELLNSGLQIDDFIVANWISTQVRNLPDTRPATLTGLATWLAGKIAPSP